MYETPLDRPVLEWLLARRLLKPVLLADPSHVSEGEQYYVPGGELVTAYRGSQAGHALWRLVGRRHAYSVLSDGAVTLHAAVLSHGTWMPASDQPTDFTVRDLIPEEWTHA